MCKWGSGLGKDRELSTDCDAKLFEVNPGVDPITANRSSHAILNLRLGWVLLDEKLSPVLSSSLCSYIKFSHYHQYLTRAYKWLAPM